MNHARKIIDFRCATMKPGDHLCVSGKMFQDAYPCGWPSIYRTHIEAFLSTKIAAAWGAWTCEQDIESGDYTISRHEPGDHRVYCDPDRDHLFKRDKDGYLISIDPSYEFLLPIPQMGAGTNVQERLVALHHLDAPWRPSDVEQREGRLVRQGNAFHTKTDTKRRKGGENMKVTLLKGTPEMIAAAGALGCNNNRSSAEILEELQQLHPTKVQARCSAVLANSFGRGHGAVGDQACYTFSLEGVSRLVTLFFCQSQHSSFLQQSMRHVKASSSGYVIPEPLGINPSDMESSVEQSFVMYQRLLDAGIPAEDARYVLPLAVKTNIQITTNARELLHYQAMADSDHVPQEVRDILCEMYPYEENNDPLQYYPAPDIFSSFPLLDGALSALPPGLISYDSITNYPIPWVDTVDQAQAHHDPAGMSLLKHAHFTFCYPMSLSALHQMIRQRTWDVTVQPLAAAAEQGSRIICPPSILLHDDKTLCEDFNHQCYRMITRYENLVESQDIPPAAAFYVLPHALQINAMIHINGWNAIHGLSRRLCRKAQWEIQMIAGSIANKISRVSSTLGKYCKPPCIGQGRCREKIPCGKLSVEDEDIQPPSIMEP